MESNPLVSVIMPAYNSAAVIGAAIRSVLNQEYSAWELLIADDGSCDNTNAVIGSFSDDRIKYFHQDNRGVGAARNLAMKNMKGGFFCFLDADDVLPPGSISSRLKLFMQDQQLDFADGCVEYRDRELKNTHKIYRPAYKGEPLSELLRLTGTCYFGNTWMIRRKSDQEYRFVEGLSHAEDLVFYLSICENGKYDYTDDTVLFYRTGTGSAMTNLEGIRKGYQFLLGYAAGKFHRHNDLISDLRKKLFSIMFRSYLKKGRFLKALRSVEFYF